MKCFLFQMIIKKMINWNKIKVGISNILRWLKVI